MLLSYKILKTLNHQFDQRYVSFLIAFDDLLKHNLQWELPSLGLAGKCNKGLDYDGIPFIIVATKVMDCQYGVDRHLKRKLESGRIRVKCIAMSLSFHLREINLHVH